MLDPGNLIVVLLVAGVLGGLVAALFLAMRRRLSEAIRPSEFSTVEERGGAIQPYILIDEEAIFRLYHQTRNAFIVQHRRIGRSSALRFVAGRLPIEGGVDLGGDVEIVTELPPVKYPSQAASIVERNLQVERRIPSYDLKGESDDGPLAGVLKSLRVNAEGIGLKVPGEVEKTLRRAWAEQRPSAGDADLDSLGGFIKMRAQFRIRTNPVKGTGWILECAWNGLPQEVVIKVRCDPNQVISSVFQHSDSVAATCFGIPGWNRGEGILEIEPISIYRS